MTVPEGATPSTLDSRYQCGEVTHPAGPRRRTAANHSRRSDAPVRCARARARHARTARPARPAAIANGHAPAAAGDPPARSYPAPSAYPIQK